MWKMLELEEMDFNELYKHLLNASRNTFQMAHKAHPDETFYTFGFYRPFTNLIIPTCNSEQAHMRLGNLTECERENETLKWFYMRWRADQWEYHYSGQEHFAPVCEWVNDNIEGYVRPRDQELIWANIANKMSAVYLKVLMALDEEKLFGQGSAREGVLLNLIAEPNHYFDKYEYARLLNPIPTYERWRIEIELCEHTQEFFDPSPNFDPDSE